jgi:Icc-related predicted phosphoesterase
VNCFFVTDLHGHPDRYRKLFEAIAAERPRVVLIGGDLLPGPAQYRSLEFLHQDFIHDFIVPELHKLREKLGKSYPRILVILGNDDGKFSEPAVLSAATEGYWFYLQNRRISIGRYAFYGYCYVPPTPFQLKDWERYDVSRYVDPGCVSPEEGRLSVPVSTDERRYATIQEDLDKLVRDDDLTRAVFLFHSPPYHTNLDRAALDGKFVDGVPLDVHVGSIAIRNFIEERQPWITLHGHIHESARLTGFWQDRLGRTCMFNAAHSGPELSLIRFRLERPTEATRELR